MLEPVDDRREAYRRGIEVVAVLAVLADLALTRAVVGGGHAAEIAPLAKWLIHAHGYPAWTAVYAVVLVAGLAGARLVGGRWGWALRVPVVVLPVAIATSNAVGVLATGAWPDSVAWGDVGGLVAVVLAVVAAGVVVSEWGRVRAVVSGLSVPPVPSADRPLVVASVLLVVLSGALAGVPASVFGPGAPAESVDRAAAANPFSNVASYAPGTTPDGLAVDGDGHVWEINFDATTLYEYSNDYSTTKHSYSVGGDLGSDAAGVSVTSDGHVWVLDTGGTLVEYKQDGTKVSSHSLSGSGFGSGGWLNDTHYLVGQAEDRDGDSSLEAAVRLYDSSNSYSFVAEYDLGTTSVEPEGMAIQNDGTIWLKDSNSNGKDAMKVSSSFEPLKNYSDADPALGLGIEPSGHFHSMDGGGNAYEEEGITPSYLVDGYVTNESSGTALDGATVQIEDSGGAQVADLTTDASGYYSTYLQSGDYTITVEATNYQTESTDISVSGAVTTNFSLTPGGGAYTFDYTLGVCYPTQDAEFDASTGRANLLRRYLTDGTHPDSELPPRPPDGLSGTIRSYNGPGSFPSAVFERVATGKEFNYKNNITATVENPDRSQYTWGLTAEIETDRAYYDLHGIEPSSASPYDQFVFEPPFVFGEDGTVIEDAESQVDNDACQPDSGGGGGDGDGTPTPVATPPGGTNATNLRPTAWFTYTPLFPNTSTEVTFSAEAIDSDGEIQSYQWVFPDGSTATGAEATYTFGQSGTRNVTLTVVDDDGAKATYTTPVYVRTPEGDGELANLAPSVFLTYDPLTPATGETTSFTADASDPDGSISSYRWTFPDGSTATGETASHAFAEAGTQDVRLSVVDDDGAKGRYQASVPVEGEGSNLAPRAFFTTDPVLATVGEDITFTADAADSDGEIQSYQWTFPDGSTATGPQASRSFASGGTYDVTLTVTDDDNATSSYTGSVTVFATDNQAPQAYFTYEPIAPEAGQSVTFTADASDSDGEIRTRTWLIGGERVTTGEAMTVTFEAAGTRDVSLLATDDDNATARYDVSVYVQPNSSTNDTQWPHDDPTALGTCTLPAGNGSSERGLLLEYWDPDYQTVALDTTVTWNGTRYNVSKTFDTPKGYYFGCIGVGEPVVPGDDAENATANTTVTFPNGTTETYNDTGIEDFSPGNGLGNASTGFTLGGGGPLISPDAGADAPLWATAIPAVAAIGFVAYRRYRGQGAGSGGTGGAGPGGRRGPPGGGPA